MYKDYVTHSVLCDCMSHEHSMTLMYFPEDLDFIYASMYIYPVTPVLKRIWKALRYVLKGEKISFGHWHEILITPNEAKQLASFLQEFSANNGDVTER